MHLTKESVYTDPLIYNIWSDTNSQVIRCVTDYAWLNIKGQVFNVITEQLERHIWDNINESH